MKIILTRDVGGVGQAGFVKEVADGYALNFLIAQGLATQATPERLAQHAKAQGELAAQKEKENEALKKAVLSLNGACIELKRRATEKGGLFKAVAPEEIAQALKEQKNVAMPAAHVHSEAIKTIGDHRVKLRGASAESEVLLKIIAA